MVAAQRRRDKQRKTADKVALTLEAQKYFLHMSLHYLTRAAEIRRRRGSGPSGKIKHVHGLDERMKRGAASTC